MRPAAEDLRVTLPVLNDSIEIGTPVMRDQPPVNRRLRGVLRELNQLVSQPTTRVTLMRLGETFRTAKPLVEYVVPAQTVCNYWNYWFTFLPGGLTDRDQVGHSLRQMLTRFPPAPAVVEAGPRRLLGRSAPTARPGAAGSGEFRPYEFPIDQHAPLRADRAAERGLPAGADRLPARAGPRCPGQSLADPANRVSDLPGSRGPTTLFYDADGDRDAVRQPGRVAPARRPGSGWAVRGGEMRGMEASGSRTGRSA